MTINTNRGGVAFKGIQESLKAQQTSKGQNTPAATPSPLSFPAIDAGGGAFASLKKMQTPNRQAQAPTQVNLAPGVGMVGVDAPLSTAFEASQDNQFRNLYIDSLVHNVYDAAVSGEYLAAVKALLSLYACDYNCKSLLGTLNADTVAEIKGILTDVLTVVFP